MPSTLVTIGRAVRSNLMADSQTNLAWATLLDLTGSRSRPPAAGRGAACGDPDRPAADRARGAAEPGTGRGARLLALGDHRGVRPARHRGLPGRPRGLGDPGGLDSGRRAAREPAACPGLAPTGPLRPGARPAGRAGVPAPPLGRQHHRRDPHRLGRRPRPARRPRPPGRRVPTIAGYLRRSRGAVATADTVTICAGITDGVARVARALRRLGVDTVGVEEPGWARLRAAVTGAGLACARCRSTATAYARTPSTASRAARRRRRAPVPQRRGALPRTPGRAGPLGPRSGRLRDRGRLRRRVPLRPPADRRMQGLDPARVALLGSVSKTLSPALGLGWLLAPTR